MVERIILNSTPPPRFLFLRLVFHSSSGRSDGRVNYSKFHQLVFVFLFERSRRRGGVRENHCKFHPPPPPSFFVFFRVFHSSSRTSDKRIERSSPPRFVFLLLVFHSSGRGKREGVTGGRQGDGVEVSGIVQGGWLNTRAWD